MEYTEKFLENKVSRFGEVFVVLDSGFEYEIHGTESYNCSAGQVVVEGMRDGEHLIVEFPLDSIEHVYTHREV